MDNDGLPHNCLIFDHVHYHLYHCVLIYIYTIICNIYFIQYIYIYK